jgi:hypothetical protein
MERTPMSRFVIEIECGRGPPFRSDGEPEIAYLLARIIEKIPSWSTLPRDGSEIALRDSLGHRIGSARLIID